MHNHLTVFAVLTFAVLACHASEPGWPEIAPLQEEYWFASTQEAQLSVDITRPDGLVLYRLECRSGLEGALVDSEFDYSGDFECRLTPLDETPEYSTLLTDNPFQTADWESRARFFASQLTGACGDYPDWGRVRDFRLRGMAIRLAVLDPVLELNESGQSALKAFRFFVSVKVAPDAVTNIAESSSYSNPYEGGNTCNVVTHVDATAATVEIGPVPVQHGSWQLVPAGRRFVVVRAPLTPDQRALRWEINGHEGVPRFSLECSADEMVGCFGPRGVSCGLFDLGDQKNLLAAFVDNTTRKDKAHFALLDPYGEVNLGVLGIARQFDLGGSFLELAVSNPIVSEAPPAHLFDSCVREVTLEARIGPL